MDKIPDIEIVAADELPEGTMAFISIKGGKLVIDLLVISITFDV